MENGIVRVEQSEEATKRKKKRNMELNSVIEPIIEDPRGYSVKKVSGLSILLQEFLIQAKKKNTIWTFAEADITDALDKLKKHKEKTGESISFTAFLITVFARVVALHKEPMNSMLKKGRELYTFQDVDVSTNIERSFPDGTKKPISYTIRKANEKTLREISDELRDAMVAKAKTATNAGKKKGWIKWVIKRMDKLPGWIRRALLNKMFNDPILKKNAMGTVNVTAVGMAGTGMGKMIHLTPHCLSMGVGGIEELPFCIDGKVLPRKLVGITFAMDHDVIDGAPAARFFHDIRQWLMYFCHNPEFDWCFKSLENPPPKTE